MRAFKEEWLSISLERRIQNIPEKFMDQKLLTLELPTGSIIHQCKVFIHSLDFYDDNSGEGDITTSR
jgi:hypothetical protein